MEKLKLMFKRTLDFLKKLYRRKVLFFTIVGSVAVIVVFLVWYLGVLSEEERVVVKEKEPVQTVIKDIFIDIPPGAFASTKEFRIAPLSDADIEAIRKNVGPFVGKVYEIKPADGKNEFAYIPMRIRFYFPPDYYYGYDFNNLTLAYIPDDNPSVYKPFNGSEIGKDERGYFVEAQVFHTSRIGVVARVPKKQELGFKMINEVPGSPKPAVVIVPGEDVNFSGFLGGKVRSNIWESLFPDRTIFVYQYPLSDARSMAYRDMVREFFDKTGSESYLEFEAERFARELKRYQGWDMDIIAHGIGGLIVRLAIESHPEIKNVKKLVLVSVPNGGTNVANPIYFASLMYGKSYEAMAKIFGLSETDMKAIYIHVFNYIETVNTYWKDVLPGSHVLKTLESLGARDDVEYLVIAGETPPLDIDASGTGLSRFYPELIKGEGDGVVSVDSARIEGKTLLRFEGSFFDYYTRSDVMSAIRDFIDKDIVPKPPSYRSDEYSEYLPKEIVEREGLTTRKSTPTVEVKKEEKTEEGFKTPEGFEVAEILPEVGSINLKDYDSAGCLDGNVYIASSEGLLSWGEILERGKFSHLKSVDGNLTMICGNETCLVNKIGFKKLKEIKGLDMKNLDDVLVLPNGDLYVVFRRETGVVELSIYRDGQLKRVDFSPGVEGKIIPLENGNFIFLTNTMVSILNGEGVVLRKFSASSMAKKGYSMYMMYALEVGNLLFVLTKDYYLLVYDENSRKSWILGEGWIGNSKILKVGRSLIILGNRSINFVDVYNRELLRFIQMFDDEIVDGFVCDRKLYLVFKSEDGYTVKVFSVGTGIL